MRTLLCQIAFGWFVALLTGVPAWAQARIEMELATQPGFSITGSHKWYKLLTDAGVDGLRIRGAKPGDTAEIRKLGTSYQVTGILTASDELVLKGGRFSSRDVGRIKQFLDDLRSEGIEGTLEKKEAFGITNRQLVEAVEDLTPPLAFDTKGVPLGQILDTLRRQLELDVVVEPAATRRLAEAEPCRDDLHGISRGTALAIALGPEGLILQPRKVRGGAVQHVITVPSVQSEAWPMGWPPQGSERELVPPLFEFINVEIAGIPLPQVLDAMQQRLKIPFLVDHTSLAREQIELEKIEPSVPAGRTYYKRILDRMLVPARLKGEIRVDEAGNTFYWITTIRQPK